MLWSVIRLIFKTSSVTPDFFYVFNLILSFSTYSQNFKKISTWELLGANVLNLLGLLFLCVHCNFNCHVSRIKLYTKSHIHNNNGTVKNTERLLDQNSIFVNGSVMSRTTASVSDRFLPNAYQENFE